MSPPQYKHQRASSPTLVGLQAVESSPSSGALTPPRGTNLAGLVDEAVASAISEIAENTRNTRGVVDHMAVIVDQHEGWHAAAQDAAIRVDTKLDMVAAAQEYDRQAAANFEARCVVEFARAQKRDEAMAAQLGKLAARVGVVGVTSVTVPQAALAALQSGNPEWIAYGAAALALLGALSRVPSGVRSLVRRFRTWRSR